jgi:hypothetical protein
MSLASKKVRMVSVKPINYKKWIWAYLEEKVLKIEIWNQLEYGGDQYYTARFPIILGGPPWYPLCFRLNYIEVEEELKFLLHPKKIVDPFVLDDLYWQSINKKFKGKKIGILISQGESERKLVELEFLLHPFKLQHYYPIMKPIDNEKEMDRKMDDFSSRLANVLLRQGSLLKETVRKIYHSCFTKNKVII